MTQKVENELPSQSVKTLGLLQVAMKGLRFYRSMLWPVALGVSAATAVIVGALLVGDSVRGSLKYLALDRLGKIDHLLLAPRFFEQSVIERWHDDLKFPIDEVGQPIPAIFFPQTTVEKTQSSPNDVDGTTRAGSVLVMGVTKDFWLLGDSMPSIEIGPNEIVLNQTLADELNVDVGSKVTIRLPAQAAVPADSPLGRRDSETVNLPGQKVIQIIPSRSLGRFDLRSNQRPSKNAFLSLETIQRVLGREGEVNGAIIPQPDAMNATESSSRTKQMPLEDSKKPAASSNPSKAIQLQLLESLPLSLVDIGIRVSHIERRFPDESLGELKTESQPSVVKIIDYYQVTTDQMLLPDSIVTKISAIWPESKISRVLTYLANGIRKVSDDADGLSIAYSTISAIDPLTLHAKSIGFEDPSIQNITLLDNGDALINSWLASELNVAVGDSLQIDYFLPETVDGREVEASFDLKIAAIVPLTEPELIAPKKGPNRRQTTLFNQSPTVFNDPALTPDVPGITDQASINDWDLPFSLTRKIRNEDDDYWQMHRLTPKLFMTLERGQALFGSRFGKVSSIRVSSEAVGSKEAVEKQLQDAIRPIVSSLGWQVIPLREQQLSAARGTTPFDVLFLALSFFVILSALILVSLLFRLGVERRASHWGLLLSLGWPLKNVRRLIFVEGLGLAIVGCLLGVGLGVLYAFSVLSLLRTWWIGAVGAPFLAFFVTGRSLAIGLLSGLLMTWLTIWLATRMLARQPMVRLLRGRMEAPVVVGQKRNLWTKIVAILLACATLAVTIVGLFLNGQAAGGAFVGAGMLALAAMMMETLRQLKKSPTPIGNLQAIKNSQTNSVGVATATSSLRTLAISSIRRNPMRSALAIGLVSVATLLILSIGLFEASPDLQGTGGFQLIAESSVPIAKSLSDEAYLREILGDKAVLLDRATIVAMRVRDGDDAGCNNLYQATQPRVLGVNARIVPFERSRPKQATFAWAGTAKPENEAEKSSHWSLLQREGDGTAAHPFPVMLDQNTALWALHLTGGVGQKFAYTFGSTELHFETVGLLQNTILQGSLLLGEENFNRAFPNISGSRSWLVSVAGKDGGVEAEKTSVDQVSELLESTWSDEGMDVVQSDSVLQNLLAVQNTYLKAFQSLGALGLLLGTFGLAVVQLRSVMERRPEFGLLRAMGFTRWRVGKLLFFESLTLLIAGLGIGCLSAAISLLPTLLHGNIRPNFLSPLAMLGVVACFGILASLVAVRRAMQTKILDALRSD
ncbi:MAG: FtsX-like permease family protein [Pirellulaceae bacterium]|nr:FtsX-like permease family protein [Pirellulaceae bacterium]